MSAFPFPRNAGWIAWILVLLAPVPLWAHPMGISSSDLTVTGNQVWDHLRINADEFHSATGLALPIPFPAEPDRYYPLPREVQARVAALLARHVQLTRGGAPCPQRLEAGYTVKTPDNVEGVFDLVFDCPNASDRLRFRMSLFPPDLGLSRHLVQVRTGEGSFQTTLAPDAPEAVLSLKAAHPWWRAAASFVRLGLHHIFTGYDHLLFLLGIALGVGRVWQLVGQVTAFTVAHTLTFFLAALGVVRLPPTVVEPLIALSICYIAVENVFIRRAPTRWAALFGFGLIHGLGFAAILQEAELLQRHLLVSVASFNVGVELGQLAVLAMAFPVLAWLRERLPSQRVNHAFSTAIFLFGLVWFVQRIWPGVTAHG